ncbi:MAG: class I SAM-dependent methyltransferase [Dehalococcoidia bacterium]
MRIDEVRRLALVEETFWWHRGRQRIVKRILDRHVPPGARILDVGCGPGGTTLSFCDTYRVFGVDASIESTRTAQGRGIAAATMDATRLGVRPRSCDAIVSLDLLEHVDDVEALREMHAALRPGGVLVVTVPAYQFLWSEHDEAVGHLRRYTRGGLQRLVQAAGFEVTLNAYVMSSILPAAIIVRLAGRVLPRRRTEPAAQFTKLPGFVNSLLERIVGLGPMPLRFVPIPFGLSIALVARRPRRIEAVEEQRQSATRGAAVGPRLRARA